MKLKKIGFFSELMHGDDDGPKLKNQIRDKSGEEEVSIIKYLNSGILYIASPGIVMDVLQESDNIICAPHIFTDGVWAWPGDLSYYVKNYHVELPQEFMEYVERKDYKIPSEGEIDLEKLIL